jgi:hypothetical protein
MQRRNLFYGIILTILGVAIVVTVILILRKRASGPDIILLPSTSTTTQGTAVPTTAAPTGDKTKPRDSYQVAPPWKDTGSGTVEPIYQPQPLNAPQS